MVSFHGGKGSGAVNDVVAFPDVGSPYDLLASGAPGAGYRLRELRKFLFDPTGEHLYVANGYKELSQVLRFVPPRPPSRQWQFECVYASDLLRHPFDVVVGFQGELFVSSQDKNWVTSYDAQGAAGRVFASGFEGVRGLAFDGSRLYVADSGADRVFIYDSTGNRLGALDVGRPVHLLYLSATRWLLIGSEGEDSVFAWSPDTPDRQPFPVVERTEPGIDHTAGIALRAGERALATMYVASRVGRQVLSFPLDFSSGQPIWTPTTTTVVLDETQLVDEPEFVGVDGGVYG